MVLDKSQGEDSHAQNGNLYQDIKLMSTPRNHVSLMQELNDVSPPIASNSTNYNNFISNLQKNNSLSIEDAEFSLTFESTEDQRDFFDYSDMNSTKSIVKDENTYIISRTANSENISKPTVKMLQAELNSQKKCNDSLVCKIAEKTDEIFRLHYINQRQRDRLLEMSKYQDLLRFQMVSMHSSNNETEIKMNMLRNVTKEWHWSKVKHTTDNHRQLVEVGSQTDFELIENNALELHTGLLHESGGSKRNYIFMRIKRLCSNAFHRLLFWGTCICILFAYLHLYNTMKYCDSVRHGTNVRFYPWEWASISDILFSVFQVKYSGPVPI